MEADADGVTDFYGLPALACRAMLEGGECFVRLRVRRPEDGLAVPLQIQLLEAEHVPLTFNTTLPSGNLVRAGIEFDRLGRRIAYHLTRAHPGDPAMRPRDHDLVRVQADRIAHLYRPLRPGQIRGEPWLARALVKLDQFDDAALVKAKVAALFTGFVVSPDPEDAVMGGDEPDEDGVVEASLEPGTMQRLSPGQDVRFACRRRLDDPHRRTEGQGVLALARQRRRPAGRLQQPQRLLSGVASRDTLPARGLSVRDIEDARKDESGRLLLSRTVVSEIGERLWADYRKRCVHPILLHTTLTPSPHFSNPPWRFVEWSR